VKSITSKGQLCPLHAEKQLSQALPLAKPSKTRKKLQPFVQLLHSIAPTRPRSCKEAEKVQCVQRWRRRWTGANIDQRATQWPTPARSSPTCYCCCWHSLPLSIVVLHKVRERRAFTGLLQERDRQLVSLRIQLHVWSCITALNYFWFPVLPISFDLVCFQETK
jgi:hypothetical protein